MAKDELVQEVKAYALEHYSSGGWDVIVESWDDDQILEAIEGCKTLQECLHHDTLLRAMVDVYSDRQADAAQYREGRF